MHKLIALSLFLVGALAAAASPLPAERDWVDDVEDALTLYQNEDSFVQKVKFSAIVHYQMTAVQPNGSNGLHLLQGARPQLFQPDLLLHLAGYSRRQGPLPHGRQDAALHRYRELPLCFRTQMY